MHLRLPILAFTMLASAVASPLHAAPFQNLDFEQATVQTAPPNPVPNFGDHLISADAAFPHWTLHEDSDVCNTVWHYPDELDITAITLVSNDSFLIPLRTPIAGNFSIELSSFIDAPVGYHHAYISQTGDIPADANSILYSFRIAAGLPAGPGVFLDGVPIPLVQLSQVGDTFFMAGDVSAFAGTTRELTFDAVDLGLSYPDENVFDLDSISFSSAPFVPEPASAALLLLAFPLLANRRTKAHV